MKSTRKIRRFAKTLMVIGILLIAIAVGLVVSELVKDLKDKNFIVNNLKYSDFKYIGIKHQEDYDNKIKGCSKNRPIIVLQMNDDIKTEFLACIPDKSWCETCNDTAVDNYEYAHLKQFFDSYKKTNHSTLEMTDEIVISSYLDDTLYIKYNDENKAELLDFSRKIIRANEDSSLTHKYKAKIKYQCGKNTCIYDIQNTAKLSQILNGEDKQVS